MDPVNNSFELERFIREATSTEAFLSLNDEDQQNMIRYMRDRYIEENPNDAGPAHVAAREANEKFLRAIGKGRYQPQREELGVIFPWETEEWSVATEQEKEQQIEDFRSIIPEVAQQDTLNQNDRAHYMNQLSDLVLREAKGADTGWIPDKGLRAFEGAAAGLLSYTGFEDQAQAVRNWVEENPKYDDDFIAKLFAGAGDLAASTLVFLGGTLATGSPVGGTTAVLAGNVTSRYNDGYRQALDLGLDEEQAVRAGVATIPGAAVDVLGDRLIAGRFLPNKYRKVFEAGTTQQKKDLLVNLLKDNTARAGMMRVARDAFTEGATEAAGDWLAGYGSYLATGSLYEEFVPTGDQLKDSFLIGAVLGGAIAGVSEGKRIRKNPDGTLTTVNEQALLETQKNLSKLDEASYYNRLVSENAVFNLLKKGDYKGAADLSKKIVVEENEETDSLFAPSQMRSFDLVGIQRRLSGEQQVTPRIEADLPEDQRGRRPIQNVEPLDFENSPESRLRNRLRQPESTPKIDEELDTLLPNRQQIRSRLTQVVEGPNPINQEQADRVLAVMDSMALAWKAADPTRETNDFYGRVNIQSTEDLSPFVEFGQIFTARDQNRNRPVRTTANVRVTPEQVDVRVGKQADVASLLRSMIAATRQAGVMEDVLGEQGMNNVRESLGIEGDFTPENDQQLADSFLNWMQERAPENNIIFSKLKEWIRNFFDQLRKIFAPNVVTTSQLDTQFERLLGLDQIQEPPVGWGPRPDTEMRYARATGQEQQLRELRRARISQRNAPVFREATENAAAARSKPVTKASPELFAIPSYMNASERFAPEAFAAINQGWKSRSKIMTVPIRHFLMLAEPLAAPQRTEAQEAINQGELLRELPSLWLDDTGQARVSGHEGRHRAIALLNAGYTHMPVEVRSARIRWSEQDNPNSMDYISDENWPTVIRNENKTQTFPYPANRLGEWILPYGFDPQAPLLAVPNWEKIAVASTAIGLSSFFGVAVYQLTSPSPAQTQTTEQVQTQEVTEAQSQEQTPAQKVLEEDKKEVRKELRDTDNFKVASNEEVSAFIDTLDTNPVSTTTDYDSLYEKILDEFNRYLDSEQEIKFPIKTNAILPTEDGGSGGKKTADISKESHIKAIKTLRDMLENATKENFEKNLGVMMAGMQSVFGAQFNPDFSSRIEIDTSVKSDILGLGVTFTNNFAAGSGASFNPKTNKINIGPVTFLAMAQPDAKWDQLTYLNAATLANELTHALQYDAKKTQGEKENLAENRSIPITEAAAQRFESHLELYINPSVFEDMAKRAKDADDAKMWEEKAKKFRGHWDTEVESFVGSYYGTKVLMKQKNQDPFPASPIDINYTGATLFSLSNTLEVGGRIPASATGVQFYYNLPPYSFEKNGQVKLGKLLSPKNGIVTVTGLEKAKGADGTPIGKEEVALYRHLIPKAFNGDNVDLKVLINGLKDLPIYLEERSNFDPSKRAAPELDAEFQALSNQKSRLLHDLDTIAPGWVISTFNGMATEVISPDNKLMPLRQAIKDEPEGRNFPAAGADIIEKLTTIQQKFDLLVFEGSEDRSSFPTQFAWLTPKKEYEMAGYTELLIRIPRIFGQIQTHLAHWRSEHTNVVGFLRGYEEIINGERVFVVFEVQSDWSQKVRNQNEIGFYYQDDLEIQEDLANQAKEWIEKYRRGEVEYYSGRSGDAALRKAEFDFNQASNKIDQIRKFNENPLVNNFQPLILRSAVQHAKRKGINKIVLADSKTVMLTEMHDTRENMRWDLPEGMVSDVLQGKEIVYSGLRRVDGDVLTGGIRSRNDRELNWLEVETQNGGWVDMESMIGAMPENESAAIEELFNQEKDLLIEEGYGRPKQEKGMQTNYDVKMPKELKRITKDNNPQPVEFGVNIQPARSFEDNINRGLMFNLSALPLTINSLFNLQTAGQNNIVSPVNHGVSFNGQQVENARQLFEAAVALDDDVMLRQWLTEENLAYLETIPVVPDNRTTYDPTERVIRLNTDSPVTAAHEVTHALLFELLENDMTFRKNVQGLMDVVWDSNDPAMARYKNLLHEMHRRYKESNPTTTFSSWFAQNILSEINDINRNLNPNERYTMEDVQATYAFTSPHEFLSIVATDVKFRNLLRQINYQGQTLWDRFISFLKNLFGVKSKNALEEIDRYLEEVFSSGRVELHTTGFQPRNYQRMQEIYGITSIPGEDLLRFYKKLKALREGKIEDRFDKHTAMMMRILKTIRPRELEYLTDEDFKKFVGHVNNIYRARTIRTNSPDIREEGNNIISDLLNLKDKIDQEAIKKIIASNDKSIDFSEFDGDLTNREELQAWVNEQIKNSEAAELKSDRMRKWREQKWEGWRQQYGEAIRQLNDRYESAEAWLDEFEKINGAPIASETLREFLLMHYDYITTLAEPANLEGISLYRHFFAANNMVDGRIAYLPETTARYLADVRDEQIDTESLREKFRDPLVSKNDFLKGLDKITRSTELAQTRLERWSAFIEGKKFLQEDLMGDLMDKIVRESENMIQKAKEDYGKFREEQEKILGRKMNERDRAVMAFTSRLIQWEVGKDPRKGLMDNIKNERRAIQNVLDAGDDTLKKMYQNVLMPMFERLISGLESSPDPVFELMNSIEERMGEGDAKTGKARWDLLMRMTDIMNQFSLDQEIVSEGFYKKPFMKQINYMPRHVFSLDPEGSERSKAKLTDEIDVFDQNQYESQSYTAVPGQLQTRKGVGSTQFYSNNIENSFDRGLRIAALTASTTSERFILKHRLREKGTVANMILGEHGRAYRVNELEAWARDLVYSAMYHGEALGSLGVIMKTINSMFARVALSGVHQGVTQTIAGFTDYSLRTDNLDGAMQALSHYTQNKKKFDQWFKDNLRWISNRDWLGETELDRRKYPLVDSNALKKSPWFQRLERTYKGAGEIITFSLRKGDDFTARSLVLAEYTRLLKVKGRPIQSIQDVDFDVVDGRILTQAVLNVERNINASNKVLRGELFTDRSKMLSLARNTMFAFSSHVMTLAAQLNMAVRDLYNLKEAGAGKEEMQDRLRLIGAILGQTFAFSTGRYIINAGLATMTLALIRDLFDDEEGKIASLQMAVDHARSTGDPVLVAQAERELRTAEIVRSQLEKFKNRNYGSQSFFKNVVREELGVLHWVFNGPNIPQKFLFTAPDNFLRNMMNEQKEAQVGLMDERIRNLRERKRYHEAAKLHEQRVMLKAAEYIPFEYPEFNNMGTGGITGTALGAIYASWKEAVDAGMGMKEYNFNDAILAAQSAGLGQADLLRYFREVDRIEDELFRSSEGDEERMKEASAKKSTKKSTKSSREQDMKLKRLMNFLEMD